ncbi:MAG: hypothetical protein AAF988_01105 [Pseudomonadota bacterium]
MRNFDQFVGIDWSGAKTPVLNNSIAVSVIDRKDSSPTFLNQKWSRSLVFDWIASFLNEDKRVLIGIDCNFGYAFDILSKQFGKNVSCYDLWSAVEENSKELPNYFAGGFWGHNVYGQNFWISGKQPDGFTMPKRETEIACAEAGLGRPESPFKLIGAKQVGKGGLAGMRVAYHLKQKYCDKIAFWPFEMDKVDQAQIVITEIYPRQFLMRAGYGTKKIRNNDDLNTVLEKLDSKAMSLRKDVSDHASDAICSAAGLRQLCGFSKNIPKSISQPQGMSYTAQTAEGWIFGIE